jgi:hypothetical protein
MRKTIEAAAATRRGRRTAVAAGLFCALALPVLAVGVPTGAATAQAPGGATYTTDQSVRLPQKFADAIIATGNASTETLTVDGTSQTVYTALLSWHGDELKTGGTAIVNKPNSYPRVNGTGDPDWAAFVPRLLAMAKTENNWGVATIRFVAPAGGRAALVASSNDGAKAALETRLASFKTKMQGLLASTTASTLFADVKVPTNLADVRNAMLDYGNTERKTPHFRQLVGAKVGTDIDLSQPYVKGKTVQFTYRDPAKNQDVLVTERVYQQPDHVLDDGLNKTAQWFAEALAAGKGVEGDGHTYDLKGGGKWQGPGMAAPVTMLTLGDRCKHFNAPCNAEIAASGWGVGGQPHGWMASDTHYRWHFGVDRVFTKIGYGAAQGKDGLWHYVGVAGGDTTSTAE